jgi:predicted enzyme related to lactoylglutathione lyase
MELLEAFMEPRVTLTIDCLDPEPLARFWSEALGYSDLGQAGEFRPLFPGDEREPVIVLQRVSETKTGKNRMHLDIHVEDLEVEVERLRSLGARNVHDDHYEGHGHTWFVMADPEGNEFCVVRRPVS